MAAGDIVKNHPQVERVIHALLDGESIYSIAKWLDPPVNVSSISNFRRFQVIPATQNADKLMRAEIPGKQSELPHELSGDGTYDNATTETLVKEAFAHGTILAVRSKRLAAMQDRWLKMKELMDSRAAEYEDVATGGHTGLLAQRVKATGTVEYQFDKALADAMMDLEQQIRSETGQTKDTGGNIAVTIVIPGQVGAAAAVVATDNSRIIDIEPARIELPNRR